jgi:hypothetical protein
MMQHHNRIAARIPDDAQHFQIAVAALNTSSTCGLPLQYSMRMRAS